MITPVSFSFRRVTLGLLLASFALGLAPAVRAQTAASSVEDRLSRLENELTTLRQENQQLRQELGVASSQNPSVIKPLGHEQQFVIGGFLHAQAEFGDQGDTRFGTGNNRFYVRRARLSMSGRYAEFFDFKLDVEMSGNLGETTGNRGQMLDGFINWTRYPMANVKVGQFKAPFGYELLSPDITLYTIERALVSDRLPINRQIGAQLSGVFLGGRLNYATGLFNGTGANTSLNDNDAFAWAGRIAGIPWQGKLAGFDSRWALGTEVFSTKDNGRGSQATEFGFAGNAFTGQRQAIGVNTQFRVGRLDLWCEYLQSRYKPDDALPFSTFDADGWYAQAAYTVLPDKLQAVVRFDSFDPNRRVDDNSTDTWTLGTNYLFSQDVKLMVDYLFFNAPGQPDHSQKLLMRLQTIF
jgi:phosphate-selective porin